MWLITKPRISRANMKNVKGIK
ncbi:hypothetical protein BDFB_008066 [Asbolus verrucosus]|uniref:Uncharacterized protein n=1 Tax=Asbolus verrucosus TaxID=1661398 RepID=A0A482WAS7_ASBVE|nr:hypothetical protein BDFB_008066 [Asbolus verrucosus]